ncbi:4-hydroxythreonine-4-phosphate dehydrogenase PdxA [Desulfobulbus alkaliphilus]|uniref:4-hydroxythreonine-4-phosphate dehydrogenase PdxA n=1 Tax=Desulfobulbus alkaliphilus TaxID=869814 RepID=UPI001964CE57|nr:4-hydroxythreonine-4-phosphate dehydrogenase PdxA [Desulfobulbus alkaliphilus]MBM9536420.1 4-hydroxythreonine-4-phosphate dehydrogenase PdxA [Desulfobulbus alkaliphilus]
MDEKIQAPIAVTMGCPAGIGPEILCKLFSEEQMPVAGHAVVIGDQGVLKQAAELVDQPPVIVPWQPGEPIHKGTLPVIQVGQAGDLTVRWGHPNRSTGKAMGRYIEEAVHHIVQGHCSALVTCPIGKKSLREAGYFYPGHTEMLAALTGTAKVRMMMAGPRLKVVLVTIHEPLCRVSQLLSRQEIVECIQTTRHALQRDFAVRHPRIAVAGLNPHAGEASLFGHEEQNIIGPAVAQCAGEGEVTGPWPPDTVFHHAVSGRFDAVVAMYHDQGLIPFKLLHFHDGVNVTLGLPLVRTSVDHGTAYDIAGKNCADPSSLAAALALAKRIVCNRRRMEQESV